MAKARWTSEQFKKQGLVETPNGFVKSASLVVGKVDKINVGIPMFNEAPKQNAKIKNATKSVVDGVKFDSNLEKYLYFSLKNADIDFEFQVQYLLQEKFRYGTEAIRAITLTVDFVINSRNIIADTKGIQTQQGAMRYKMLKKHLYDIYSPFAHKTPLPEIVMLKNRKECDAFVNKLRYNA